MTRRRGRSLGALGAVLIVVGASGCSGLPASSPVEQGYDVGEPYFAPIRVKFDPPKPGASPEDIVKGFLAAGAAAEDDHAAARAYLTSAASRRWQPGDRVAIYRDSASLTAGRSGDVVSVRAPLVARLDGSGRYLAASSGENAHAHLTLTKVNGEWRISDLPPGTGLWLDRVSFDQLYSRFAVTYADPVDRSLVGDYRWVPVGKGPVTALARLQLEEVPAYLRGTATTGFPVGTQLAVESVPIVDGVAQIDLRQRALAATPEERATAWAQMLRTMRQIPGVKGVAITVGGAPLQVDGIDGPPTTVAELGFVEPETEPPAVVLRQNETLRAMDLNAWTRGENRPFTDAPALPAAPPDWERLAIQHDLQQVVAVDHGRTKLFRKTPDATGGTAAFGKELTEPSMDKRGRIWVGGVDAAGASRIWGVNADTPPKTAPYTVPASWLSGKVTAVKPSPSGRRLAVALTDAAGLTSIHVTGIRPGKRQFSASLGEPWRIVAGLTDLKDMAWAGDASIAVLAGQPGSTVTPMVLPVGGALEPLAPVQRPSQITSAGGPRGIIVVSETGAVWRRVGGAWRRQDVAQELIVPGT